MAEAQEKEATEQRILRVTDIEREPLQFLTPIGGYEEVPLVSLEEAVVPLVSILPAVQNHAYVAKQRCKNPPDGLSVDESASIMLYTMGWQPLNKCLYFVLNEVLRSPDREQKLEPWYLFMRLFLGALFRLPPIPTMAFRGVKLDLSKRYTKGNKIVWWGFSSCTTSVDVLNSNIFLGSTGDRTIFTLQSQTGRNIRKHSYFPTEDEVLLLAGTQFEVKGYLQQGNLHIIQLEESIPPFPLLIRPSMPIASSLQINSTHSAIPNIPLNTRWKQNGVTVAAVNGKGDVINQFANLYSLSVDRDQTMVITDAGNHRVVQWKKDDIIEQIIAGGNGEGNRLDQLKWPTNVVVDKESNSLIIADRHNRRVMGWSLRNGTRQGEILIDNIDCWGLTMDDQRYLYVSDYKKHEVRRYRLGDKNGTVVAGANGCGYGLNQLNQPRYLFVDQQQNVYISDNENHRVMKWNKGAREGIVVAGGNGIGNTLAQLWYPNGICVDALNTIYVADTYNHRVMRWSEGDRQGTVIVGGNGEGARANQLNRPIDLSLDRHGNLYVLDRINHRVQRFDIE